MLKTPKIPTYAFSGSRGITFGTGVDGVGDLATILQGVREDLLSSDADLSSVGVESSASQSLKFEMPGGASNDVDLLVPEGLKFRILDVKAVMKGDGQASDTLQVKKVDVALVETPISDAVDASLLNGSILRSTTVDTTVWELDGDLGDTLRVSQVDAAGDDSPEVSVFVEIQLV